VRLVVAHAEDGLEAQRAGGRGEEEVLRHHIYAYLIANMLT
jgi:hypothetical protein